MHRFATVETERQTLATVNVDTIERIETYTPNLVVLHFISGHEMVIHGQRDELVGVWDFEESEG
jgi:uncharacterized protein YlzI (FlbEa/FlbD family)